MKTIHKIHSIQRNSCDDIPEPHNKILCVLKDATRTLCSSYPTEELEVKEGEYVFEYYGHNLYKMVKGKLEQHTDVIMVEGCFNSVQDISKSGLYLVEDTSTLWHFSGLFKTPKDVEEGQQFFDKSTCSLYTFIDKELKWRGIGCEEIKHLEKAVENKKCKELVQEIAEEDLLMQPAVDSMYPEVRPLEPVIGYRYITAYQEIAEYLGKLKWHYTPCKDNECFYVKSKDAIYVYEKDHFKLGEGLKADPAENKFKPELKDIWRLDEDKVYQNAKYEALMKHLEKSSEVYEKFPEWKKGSLKRSFEATNPEPRPKVESKVRGEPKLIAVLDDWQCMLSKCGDCDTCKRKDTCDQVKYLQSLERAVAASKKFNKVECDKGFGICEECTDETTCKKAKFKQTENVIIANTRGVARGTVITDDFKRMTFFSRKRLVKNMFVNFDDDLSIHCCYIDAHSHKDCIKITNVYSDRDISDFNMFMNDANIHSKHYTFEKPHKINEVRGLLIRTPMAISIKYVGDKVLENGGSITIQYEYCNIVEEVERGNQESLKRINIPASVITEDNEMMQDADFTDELPRRRAKYLEKVKKDWKEILYTKHNQVIMDDYRNIELLDKINKCIKWLEDLSRLVEIESIPTYPMSIDDRNMWFKEKQYYENLVNL